MTTQELLEGLSKDLAEINAPRRAHIQIANLIEAYKQEAGKQEPKLEAVEDE